MSAANVSVSLVAPIIGDEEVAAVERVLRSGQVAHGPESRAFEQEFANLVGLKHAITVNSGTAAIHAALEAVGVERGAEVVTTPFTFAATATPILMLGARPRFVDIDENTFNADGAALAGGITSATKAAVAVDLFGLPVDPVQVAKLQEKGIPVVEDACQAIGARREGVNAGAIGAIGAFSLYATKNIMTGEGGVITTHDEILAERTQRFRNHGQSLRYEYISLGYNYRLTDIQAAIGRVQLQRLAWINQKRRENAALYDRLLAGIAGLTTPFVPRSTQHVYHQYTIRVDSEKTPNGIDRDSLRTRLAEHGIASGVYYPKPLHLQPLFAQFGYGPGDFPVAERCALQVLSLPIHPRLDFDQITHVAETIRQILGI